MITDFEWFVSRLETLAKSSRIVTTCVTVDNLRNRSPIAQVDGRVISVSRNVEFSNPPARFKWHPTNVRSFLDHPINTIKGKDKE